MKSRLIKMPPDKTRSSPVAVSLVQDSGLDGDATTAGVEKPVVQSSAPEMGLHVGIGSHTHRGARPANEDFAACYVGPKSGQPAIGIVAALADGMGGAKGGRTAAELAVRGFIEGCIGQSFTVGVARVSARAA